MYCSATSPRFSLGRSIPATRAIWSLPLALTLLVPRVLADDSDHAVSPHDLAMLTARLDARSHFHSLNIGEPRNWRTPQAPSLVLSYLNLYVMRPRVRS